MALYGSKWGDRGGVQHQTLIKLAMWSEEVEAAIHSGAFKLRKPARGRAPSPRTQQLQAEQRAAERARAKAAPKAAPSSSGQSWAGWGQ